MLTGRDPLEAALAAGETPSPELVAAAGESTGLRPALAWGLLGLTLVGLALVPLVGSTFRLLEKVPAGKPPAALEDRARDFIRRVAPEATDMDDAWGLGAEWGYTGHIRRRPPRSTAGTTSRTAIRPCCSSGIGRARGRSCRCSRAARSTG